MLVTVVTSYMFPPFAAGWRRPVRFRDQRAPVRHIYKGCYPEGRSSFLVWYVYLKLSTDTRFFKPAGAAEMNFSIVKKIIETEKVR